MESKNMNQQSFAQALGISSASLSSIFNGRTKPTLNHVEAIRKKFPNISLDWLMFGKGDMYTQDNASNPSTPPLSGASTPDAGTTREPSLNFDQDASYPSEPRGSANAEQGTASPINPQANIEKTVVKYVDKPHRKITEIRVFFDDQTYELFVPKDYDI